MKDYSLEFNDAIINGKWINVKYKNSKEITKFYARKIIEIWRACTFFNVNRRSKNTLSFINSKDILQQQTVFLYITLP